MKKDYIPRQDGKLLIWLENYKVKLAVHQKTLGISDEDFKAQMVLCDTLIALIKENAQKQKDAQESRAKLETGKKTQTPLIREEAQRSKKAKLYTNGIGEDMGIVGDENATDIENSKPALTAKKVETGWRLSFNLEGFFDAVKIFRQRPSQSKQFIAVDTSSPYIDTDAQVNGTSYTAWFMMGDDTVGKESDAVVISI